MQAFDLCRGKRNGPNAATSSLLALQRAVDATAIDYRQYLMPVNVCKTEQPQFLAKRYGELVR